MIDLTQIFNGPEIFGYSGIYAEYDKKELESAIKQKAIKLVEYKLSAKDIELAMKQLYQHPIDIHHECNDVHILIPILEKYTDGWKYKYFFGDVGCDAGCDIEIYRENKGFITSIEVGWTKASRVIQNFDACEKLETFLVVPFILGTKRLSPSYYSFTKGSGWNEFVEYKRDEQRRYYDEIFKGSD